MTALLKKYNLCNEMCIDMLHDIVKATYRGDYRIELETLYAKATGSGLPEWMEPEEISAAV
jgi:hypothetical protein